MKNTNKMTPAELRALADKIEEEQLEAMPTKVGYLKHDLYEFRGDFDLDESQHGYLSPSEMKMVVNRMKQKINESFVLVAKKGTEFKTNNEFVDELWCDNEFNIVDMDDGWAKRNLGKIKEVPSNK